VSRRLVNLTLDNLGELSTRCRSCVFWELDAAAGAHACADGSAALEKEAWVSDTLLEWGCCGQQVIVDGVSAGHVLYAPPAYVPRSLGFATSPAGPDAVLLMSAYIDPAFRGGGLGRMLVQGVARDITRRGIRAVEAFGRAGSADAANDDSLACLPPVDYLLAVGFKTVRPHHRTPRLRLDIRSIASWKEDVEYAFERLFGSMVPALGKR
jgi:GNAT superfamily N-acetyltransferase